MKVRKDAASHHDRRGYVEDESRDRKTEKTREALRSGSHEYTVTSLNVWGWERVGVLKECKNTELEKQHRTI